MQGDSRRGHDSFRARGRGSNANHQLDHACHHRARVPAFASKARGHGIAITLLCLCFAFATQLLLVHAQ